MPSLTLYRDGSTMYVKQEFILYSCIKQE